MRGGGRTRDPAVLKISDAIILAGAQEGADMEKETGVRHVCVSEMCHSSHSNADGILQGAEEDESTGGA